MTTIAGDGCCYSGNGGPATSAQFNSANYVAVDSLGDVFISDYYNNVVRMVPATTGLHYGQNMTAGAIYNVAGNGIYGYNNDNQPATSAEIEYPQGIAIDSSGNIYIADYNGAASGWSPQPRGPTSARR